MSSPTFGASAFEAPRSAAQAFGEVHKRLNGRSIPSVIPSIEKLSKDTQIYVFNVGPWAHSQWTGCGKYVVPPCPEGKTHSNPLVIPGIVGTLYPNDEKSMRRFEEEGMNLVNDILGIGPNMHPGNSLIKYGVAACHQWPPTKEEIAKAWKALAEGELSDLIQEANAAAATGPQEMERTINKRHFEAARLLKKSTADCPWLQRSVQTAERIECKFCGEPMKNNIPRCPNCKEIVNQKLYDELIAKK